MKYRPLAVQRPEAGGFILGNRTEILYFQAAQVGTFYGADRKPQTRMFITPGKKGLQPDSDDLHPKPEQQRQQYKTDSKRNKT